MDNLQETIATLSPEDAREFKLFINRQKKKKNRKDLELFELLMKKRELKAREIMEHFYSEKNRNAYHSIRKRLFRHLSDFIVLKRMDDDTTAASSVRGMISLSQYLFDKKADRLGWLYLKKSEEIAIENEQFDLLNGIYHLQMENSHSEYSENLKEIIRKRNENKKAVDEEDRAVIAKSIIQKELKSVITEGREVNFDRIISRVLKECELEDVAAKRPKLIYHIMSIVRSAILAKKDYFSFEPYAIEKYRETAKYGFSKSNHYYKLNMLYMISHVLYRNRKFNESEKYLEMLKNEMESHNRSHYDIFYPKYITLLSVVKSYCGKNNESIKIQQMEISAPKAKFSLRDELTMKINMAVYYFNAEEYKKANEALMSIQHTDNWFEKKAGKEALLRKNLIEMMVQYEMENDDIAMNRIRSIERHFADLFENPIYKRVKTFLGFVKDFFNNPESVTTVEFEKKVIDSKIFLPDDYEDIRAIAFFCWLKSKMVKQPYYKVLVERVNTRMDFEFNQPLTQFH